MDEERVKLVGIVNLSLDSFYRDPTSKLTRPEEQAAQFLVEGAAMIDIGAEATNPHATALSPQDEWLKLSQVLPFILGEKKFAGGVVSVDTYHAETAALALAMDNLVINDVMTFRDPKMREVVAAYGAACIVSHAPRKAKTIAEVHTYELDDIEEIVNDLESARDRLINAGVSRENIILDPGIGFGKSMRLNWRLLQFARYVNGPVMIGYSHKRFLGTDPVTGEVLPDATERRKSLEVNVEAGRIAISHGVEPLYLRVHEVAAHRSLLAA